MTACMIRACELGLALQQAVGHRLHPGPREDVRSLAKPTTAPSESSSGADGRAYEVAQWPSGVPAADLGRGGELWPPTT